MLGRAPTQQIDFDDETASLGVLRKRWLKFSRDEAPTELVRDSFRQGRNAVVVGGHWAALTRKL